MHVRHEEILVEALEGRAGAAPAAGHDGCGQFSVQLLSRHAEAQPVQEGRQPSVGSAVVHRRAYHDAVELIDAPGDGVDLIVEHAFSRGLTGAAGDAVGHGLLSQPEGLGLDPVLLQYADGLLHGDGGAAVLVGASVYE